MNRVGGGARRALAGVCIGAVTIAACGGSSTGGPVDGGASGRGGTGATGGLGAFGGTGATGALGGTGGFGNSGSIDPMGDGTRPPAMSGGNPGTGSLPTVLAASRLFLGEHDSNGVPKPSAWQAFGFNLDGILSTKTGTNHCKLYANSPPTNKQDGNGGIDNGFGQNLLPILKTFVPSPSDETNQAIADGDFSILFKLDNLDSNANQSQVSAALYGGADLGFPPAFNGSDLWPVTPELLNGGNINDPRVKFPNSYVTGGTWVSGSKGSVPITMVMGGSAISLNIVGAVVVLDISGTGSSASGTKGVIGGVISTAEFVSEIEKIAGQLTAGQLCPGNPTLEGALTSIRQASDIMLDGSNGDPSKQCDAISVGIGFDARAVQLGSVASPAVPPPDPCVP